MGAIALQVGHQKAKNSTSSGLPETSSTVVGSLASRADFTGTSTGVGDSAWVVAGVVEASICAGTSEATCGCAGCRVCGAIGAPGEQAARTITPAMTLHALWRFNRISPPVRSNGFHLASKYRRRLLNGSYGECARYRGIRKISLKDRWSVR